MAPLNRALTGKNQLLEWTEVMLNAFSKTKEALANATMLHHPLKDAPTSLTVDTSDMAVGAVLEQFAGGVWRLLTFSSRQLRKPETKCSTFDRELLAMHLAIRHFGFFLMVAPLQFIQTINH